MSNNNVGHHSNTGVETGCSSLSFRVSWNKVRMALFSPSTLQIGTSSDYGVGLVVHVGNVMNAPPLGLRKFKNIET